MNTFTKNQRRILRGLMAIAAEREAGIKITELRKLLASARLGCNNLSTINKIYAMLDDFERHIYVDYDNLPSEARIFHVAKLYQKGILTTGDLVEFDDEMKETFNQALTILEANK